MAKNNIDFEPFIKSTNRHFARFRFLVDSNDQLLQIVEKTLPLQCRKCISAAIIGITIVTWFLDPSGFSLLTGLYSTIGLILIKKEDSIMKNNDKNQIKNFIKGNAFGTMALFGLYRQ